MHLSRNIKYLRKTKGWTQDQLAKKLDKNLVTVGDYERGRLSPPINVLVQICEIFQVDLDTLVHHDIAKDGLPTPPEDRVAREEQLLREIRTLRQLSDLQGQRLADLEREIGKQAPDLAKQLGLDKRK